MQPISYARHQFLPEVIRHTVRLYLRFTLSYRDVEELLAERGLDLSYETVRRWVLKFGPAFARNLRRLRPQPSRRWHLDEMAIMIAGKRLWLWRAVDSEGELLDMLVQPRRDRPAALRLMRKLLKKQGYAPDVPVTIGWPPTGAPVVSLGCEPGTNRACGRTTAPRTRIRWCADESGRCSGSSRLDQRSASSPSMPPCTTPSTPSVTSSPAAHCASSEQRLPGIGRPRRQQPKLAPALFRSRAPSSSRDNAQWLAQTGPITTATSSSASGPG
jgi:transposase-like protein